MLNKLLFCILCRHIMRIAIFLHNLFAQFVWPLLMNVHTLFNTLLNIIVLVSCLVSNIHSVVCLKTSQHRLLGLRRITYPKSVKIQWWELFLELKIIIFNLFIRVYKTSSVRFDRTVLWWEFFVELKIIIFNLFIRA